MSPLVFRKMRLEDAPLLAQIDGQDNALGWTQSMFEQEFLLPQSLQIVLEQDGQICGFAVAWVVAGVLQILELAVERLSRGRGLATQLLRELFRQAKQKNCQSAELELRQDNERALRLYQKLGFKIVGKRPNFYQDKNGQKTDAFLMNLSL